MKECEGQIIGKRMVILIISFLFGSTNIFGAILVMMLKEESKEELDLSMISEFITPEINPPIIN